MKIKSKGLFCKFLKVFDQGLNCNFQKLQGLFCQFWNLGIVTSPPSRVRWPNGNLPPATAGFAGNGAANLRSTPKPPNNFFTLLGTSPCPRIQQITQGLAGKSLKNQAAVEFFMNSGEADYGSSIQSDTTNRFLLTHSIHWYQLYIPRFNRLQSPKIQLKTFITSQEHSRTSFDNQTPFSIWFLTPNSTYNIPKRWEKHALQHGIIKTFKKSRLQKFII